MKIVDEEITGEAYSDIFVGSQFPAKSRPIFDRMEGSTSAAPFQCAQVYTPLPLVYEREIRVTRAYSLIDEVKSAFLFPSRSWKSGLRSVSYAIFSASIKNRENGI
jgi:hypothetical protein